MDQTAPDIGRVSLDQWCISLAAADEGSFSAPGQKLLRAQSAIGEAVNTGAQPGVGSPATAAAHRQ